MNEQTFLEECKTLCNDIQHRIKFWFQVFGLLLSAMGALFSLGLKGEAFSPTPLLFYPVIAMFLT